MSQSKTRQTATGVTSDEIHSNTLNHHSFHLLHGSRQLVHVPPTGPSILTLLPLAVFPLQVEWAVSWAELSHGGGLGEGGRASPSIQHAGDGAQRKVCDPDAGKHHL